MHYDNIYTYAITDNGVSELPNVIGDIVLTREQMEQLESGGEGTAQAFYLRARRWPNGVLPYQIDDSTIRKF